MEIRIENLQMRYGVKEVLSIEHLRFEQGKTYGLVGHNGAGKTTLFKSITNIIATYSGDIFIGDANVKEDNKVLLNVGIVLDGMSVYQDHTGWFNILYFSGLRGEHHEEEARRLAVELDLLEALEEKVSNYSYGMQKKLILLIALLHNPKILILDEPFRGLDLKTVAWFKEYLKALTKNGQTLLISSHVQNDLETLCDEVVVIDKGRILESIDLVEERKTAVRLLLTSDNHGVATILKEYNFPFQMNKEGLIKLDTANPLWMEVYHQLYSQEIMITEMSKAPVLADKLN
ncbi:ATP-binding cassette domain-containing protein [Vagococcus sp. BWB3-3]|uniref:ATP-binding cassette domain-containing protein n=1 Tax=Vagococcus allomyrinae TaxID=2794353 RepID=A0A940SZK3_9ENTE|nr:ATP-binding cassette domain-containing protein [Vagococcus allomyrinae]MBP1044518.1 ATP-binding cassette domain-containing protein [Vagococcus allomyrinae]